MSKRIHLYIDLHPYSNSLNIVCQDNFIDCDERDNWKVTEDIRKVTCRKCQSIDKITESQLDWVVRK